MVYFRLPRCRLMFRPRQQILRQNWCDTSLLKQLQKELNSRDAPMNLYLVSFFKIFNLFALIQDTLCKMQWLIFFWFWIAGSLAALVYQHSITPLALPCKLLLPEPGKWLVFRRERSPHGRMRSHALLIPKCGQVKCDQMISRQNFIDKLNLEILQFIYSASRILLSIHVVALQMAQVLTQLMGKLKVYPVPRQLFCRKEQLVMSCI